MEISRASKSDIGKLALLQRRYMEHHANIDDYFTFEEDMTGEWIKYVEKFIECDDNLVLVALEGEKIIGYMTGSIKERTPIYKEKRVGIIGDVFVVPEKRRKGVFTGLASEMLRWMRQKGVRYVEHPISSRNDVSMSAWKSMGFEDFMVWTRRKI
jgi:GNAT superfamily N-acetyltransferase